MEILYKPSFLREFKRLPIEVQEEAKIKISLFRDIAKHKQLRVRKLKGKLKQYYSFSVTHEHRIVFEYENRQSVVFIAIGTHDIYR